MHIGKLVFAQIMEHIPMKVFHHCVRTYDGNHKVPARTIQAKAPGDEELSLMRHLDALHLHYPFYGARRLRDALLDEQDLIVDRKHVRRLMLLMDIHAVYPGNKGTSKPNKAHRIYPYLLRDIEIN